MDEKEKDVETGGTPEWVQKLENSINNLTEKLTAKAEQPEELEQPVKVPVPPTPPQPEEIEPEEIEPEDLEPEQPEKKPNRAQAFLNWLF